MPHIIFVSKRDPRKLNDPMGLHKKVQFESGFSELIAGFAPYIRIIISSLVYFKSSFIRIIPNGMISLDRKL